ncbi:Golgi resident protein GCP60 [Blattella germanica]|nr:Golgi resident protein GCP60 [Blattella germanica]
MTMASDRVVSLLHNNLDRLSVASEDSLNRSNVEGDTSREDEDSIEKWGFQLGDLYRLALKFYKETGKTLCEKIEKIEGRTPELNFIWDVNNVLLGESRCVNRQQKGMPRVRYTLEQRRFVYDTYICERSQLKSVTLAGVSVSSVYKATKLLNFKSYKFEFSAPVMVKKEGKAVHLSYEDKLRLVAFTCQVSHGKFNPDTLPPLGVLDVIGRDRRLAWQSLGAMSRDEAMSGFVDLLDKLCPLFKPFVEAHKWDIEERDRIAREEEVARQVEAARLRLEEEMRQQEEENRAKQEAQRRQIQEALNQQTYHQFKSYAEQQYPGNPEQQGVLIRQLQEQHYHQYMQQLYQQQKQETTTEIPTDETEKLLNGGTETVEESEEDASQGEFPTISAASMWTRKDIKEFKESIRKEGGDAIIKVGHGETVTVRVPTHEDGTCLFWEFATDSYDIGFGVYFEWTKSTSNQVSVHISEKLAGEDVERGSGPKVSDLSNRPPLSIIVPVYRRDCQEEVYAGRHEYPGQGVYLLKFDNSYSLWRSKTLYYRVYYTR